MKEKDHNSDLRALIDSIRDSIRRARTTREWSDCIEICRRAQEKVPDPDDFQDSFAIRISLVTCLLNRNAPEDMEEVIAEGSKIVRALTIESHPKEWYIVNRNISHAYWMRERGERAANLLAGVKFAKSALQALGHGDASGSDWADAQSLLGFLYAELVEKFHREEWRTPAIDALSEALWFFSDDYPQEACEIREQLSRLRD